jgi:flagellar biosynthesis protein FlhF
MQEALRLVKLELGDNAVILSAKEVRSGGFFSTLRKKSVEITAATDYPIDEADSSTEFSEMLSSQLDAESETDRVSLSSAPQAIESFEHKSRSFPNQTQASNHIRVRTDKNDTKQAKVSITEAEGPDQQAENGLGESETSSIEPVRYETDNHWIAEPFYLNFDSPKTIALVGPSGVGKSTMVAKLAWHCRVVEKKKVALISLDRFRVGANGMLARVARIMNLSLTIVRDTEQMQSALDHLADVDVLLIDTPGMGSNDASMLDDVREILQSAKPDETHLVANATVRDDVFAAIAKTFSPLGVNHLLITHMDESIKGPPVLKILKSARIPTSFYSDRIDLFDGLQETSADWLDGLATPTESAGARVTVFSSKRKHSITRSVEIDDTHDSVQYVANRNSELFHHLNCKSLRRINAENLSAFNSMEQAIDEGFKPCRACINIGMMGKSETETFGRQHSNAI